MFRGVAVCLRVLKARKMEIEGFVSGCMGVKRKDGMEGLNLGMVR